MDDETEFVGCHESSRTVPSGIVGPVDRALHDNALLGTLTVIGVASVLTGLVAGTVVLSLVRLLGDSWGFTSAPRCPAASLARHTGPI